jgi:UDP-N-acetylmuramoylalanine--D-glutamate ligase
VRFINDSKATNPHAAAAGLRALEGRVIAIVGGYDKGLDFKVMADAIRENVSVVIYMGPAGPRIARAVGDVVRCEPATDLKGAVDLAFAEATYGDTVILSPGCSSFDAFKDFEDRGRQFKRVVRGLDNGPG